mgnify:CR=1 FL=1
MAIEEEEEEAVFEIVTWLPYACGDMENIFFC